MKMGDCLRTAALMFTLGAPLQIASGQRMQSTASHDSARAALESARAARGKALDSTCTTAGLDREVYASILNRNFVALLGSAKSVPGSFGALEIDKEQKAKFAASSQPGSGRVFGIEATGSVEDGILALIDDKESSTAFTVDLKLHFLRGLDSTDRPTDRKGRTMLEYDSQSCYAYVAALQTAGDSLEARLADVGINGRELRRQSDTAQYAFRIDSIGRELAKVRARLELRNPLTTDSARILRIKRDGLLVDSARAEAALANAKYRFIPKTNRQEFDARDKYSADLRAAQDLLKVTGFSIGWASVTIGVVNTSFKLYDPDTTFADQIDSESFASPRIGLSYSRFTLVHEPNRSRFWTLGLQGALEDNLGTLGKIELTDTEQLGPNPDDRVATRKTNARKGDYKDNLASLTGSADWYQFFFRNNQSALHVFPRWIAKRDSKPTYQVGLGLLWSARDEKSAFVNAELFYNLTDIGEAEPSDDNVWERSQLGLRLSFPLNYTSR